MSTLGRLLDDGIEMNRQARNTYAGFGLLLVAAGLGFGLLWGWSQAIAPAAFGAFFALLAVHAESLRRKLARAKKEHNL